MGTVNPGFEAEGEGKEGLGMKTLSESVSNGQVKEKVGKVVESEDDTPDRQQWSSPIEFLLSCIAMSVGLGNVWRFPFTAFENGGGAFLIPYIIVLFVIGKPIYYLEMAIGQFSSFGSVKVWEISPAMKGVGYGQMIATISVVTYYCSLMAITVFYFVASFQAELPWSKCQDDWENCFDASSNLTNTTNLTSSSELYFSRIVLQEKDNIEDGVGAPEWKLTLCLLFSWISIFLVLAKGVQSSGKVAYFTALFPYVVLITLLIRGVTLPGAVDGIIYFINPQWEKLLEPKVWYNAVSQSFFSLSVSFGPIIMYSSYNPFRHNVHRDALIVSIMDTLTSLLAGFTIFAILGNLKHELGRDSIKDVVKGGAGLAFVSYPDAIAKFDVVPQLFAVLFFLMLYTLGIGSAVSLTGAVITIICDQVPSWKRWIVTLVICIGGFLIGLVYVTPGGQAILGLVDYFGGTFIIFVLSVIEMATISWVYGLENICRDVEFMLERKVGIYWRFCWGLLTPLLLLVILVYSLVELEPLIYNGMEYPTIAIVFGWLLMAFAVAQVPIWMIFAFVRNRGKGSLWQIIKTSFRATELWGPKNPKTFRDWKEFKESKKRAENKGENKAWRVIQMLLGRIRFDQGRNS